VWTRSLIAASGSEHGRAGCDVHQRRCVSFRSLSEGPEISFSETLRFGSVPTAVHGRGAIYQHAEVSVRSCPPRCAGFPGSSAYGPRLASTHKLGRYWPLLRNLSRRSWGARPPDLTGRFVQSDRNAARCSARPDSGGLERSIR
jgi:hypothetical protein